jgi:hypothetical protein
VEVIGDLTDPNAQLGGLEDIEWHAEATEVDDQRVEIVGACRQARRRLVDLLEDPRAGRYEPGEVSERGSDIDACAPAVRRRRDRLADEHCRIGWVRQANAVTRLVHVGDPVEPVRAPLRRSEVVGDEVPPASDVHDAVRLQPALPRRAAARSVRDA